MFVKHYCRWFEILWLRRGAIKLWGGGDVLESTTPTRAQVEFENFLSIWHKIKTESFCAIQKRTESWANGISRQNGSASLSFIMCCVVVVVLVVQPSQFPGEKSDMMFQRRLHNWFIEALLQWKKTHNKFQFSKFITFCLPTDVSFFCVHKHFSSTPA